MGHPRHLPRATEAVIPRHKLVDYVLNPAHPHGRHKARVFASALGIRQADWAHLRREILKDLADAEAREVRTSRFGAHYEVVVNVRGLNGATKPVTTAWLVAERRPPRLVSARVQVS